MFAPFQDDDDYEGDEVDDEEGSSDDDEDDDDEEEDDEDDDEEDEEDGQFMLFYASAFSSQIQFVDSDQFKFQYCFSEQDLGDSFISSEAKVKTPKSEKKKSKYEELPLSL